MSRHNVKSYKMFGYSRKGDVTRAINFFWKILPHFWKQHHTIKGRSVKSLLTFMYCDKCQGALTRPSDIRE